MDNIFDFEHAANHLETLRKMFRRAGFEQRAVGVGIAIATLQEMAGNRTDYVIVDNVLERLRQESVRVRRLGQLEWADGIAGSRNALHGWYFPDTTTPIGKIIALARRPPTENPATSPCEENDMSTTTRPNTSENSSVDTQEPGIWGDGGDSAKQEAEGKRRKFEMRLRRVLGLDAPAPKPKQRPAPEAPKPTPRLRIKRSAAPRLCFGP